ncbi:protein FAM210B, mitochondrial isoform X1 [Pseudonaja textilis]|uniref:Family with sequence similarity 210 member B n=1 Tax=Pseudonaja textilis TaxID=8673 RepID=A0A670XTQ8_PSETE|nr:protein FAM210B, mitochondrial isoform X1 [Pseudonaja textilis]
MRWLGQPCALAPFLPRGAFQTIGGRVALNQAAGTGGGSRTGAVGAGGAAPGFLPGQAQLNWAVESPLPGRGHQRSGPRLLRRLLRGSGLLVGHPAHFALLAAAGGSEPLRRPYSQLETPAVDPKRLRPEVGQRAAKSDYAGGEESRGGPRGNLAPPKTTGTSPENRTDPNQENGKKPNKSHQLKKIFKEYGAVGVTFHIGISLVSLGMFYLVVSSGVDMTTILFKLGFDEALVRSKLAAGTSTFVLAYAIHKLFAPVRISITVVSVPFLVRYFRKIGIFKPPAPNP